jgi:HSP20 family protein
LNRKIHYQLKFKTLGEDYEKSNSRGYHSCTGNCFRTPNLSQSGTPGQNFDDDLFNGRAWNPYEEMQHMQDEMELLFGDSFSRFHLNFPLGSLSKSPDVDLQEKVDQYIVTVNAPGANESSINVKLEGSVLDIAIKTEQGTEDNDQNKDYKYRERFIGEFKRVITLPGAADAAKMKTEYHNGVLTITIPKK